jgi:hypothetical protein
VAYYGHEARSYALYFMLAALALWLWIFTDRRSKGAAAAFGVVFLLGMAIHYYFLLCLLPFGITALAERRFIDRKVIAASAGILISAAVLYPQIASSRTVVGAISPMWAPSRHKLLEAYLNFSSNLALPLVIMAIAALVFGLARDHKVAPMSDGERVCWLFLALPLAADILARVLTHSFHDRYIISAGPGIIVGATCLLWRHWRYSPRLSVVLLLAFTGSAVGQQVLTLRAVNQIVADTGNYQERTRQILALEDTLLREGKQHLLITQDVWYLEAWYYSPHRVQLECLTEEKRWGIKNYIPLRFVSMQDILAHSAETAVIAPGRAVTEKLVRAGLRFKVRFTEPQTVLYLE